MKEKEEKEEKEKPAKQELLLPKNNFKNSVIFGLVTDFSNPINNNLFHKINLIYFNCN